MAGLQNGELLARAEQFFDALITMDGNIQFQQHYAELNLIIVALRAPSNRLSDTEPLMAKVLVLRPTLKPGTLAVVS